MEGGRGGYETSRFRSPENPERQFRNSLRQEANSILYSTENQLAAEIAEKIVQKIDIKDHIDEMNLHKDDPSIYQAWKQLGLFIVIDTTSQVDWKDEASGLEIKKGDKVLDIHLPPLKPEDRTLGNVTDSMRLIAQYIAQQELNPKYLIGVTFEKLARVSQRQGFHVIEPKIPEDIQRGIERVYNRFTNRGVNSDRLGKVVMCYQSTQQFLGRYLQPRR